MGVFGTGLERLCAVTAASSAKEMAAQVRAAAREVWTVELRLDWLRNDRERAAFLAWLKNAKFRGATFMATCRRRAGGGKYDGDLQGELYWLIQARAAGCTWCDLEIETLRELPDESVREYAVPPKVLLSMHDFRRTPPLPRVVKPPAHGGVDAVKMAATAQTIEDSLRLLRLARRSKKFVAVPMGEAGLPARILALREGSALAYAPLGEATAPGQILLREMKYLYRAHELTSRTRVYGVIGDPIGHSLSPQMQNAGFQARAKSAAAAEVNRRKRHSALRRSAVPQLGVTCPHCFRCVAAHSSIARHTHRPGQPMRSRLQATAMHGQT